MKCGERVVRRNACVVFSGLEVLAILLAATNHGAFLESSAPPLTGSLRAHDQVLRERLCICCEKNRAPWKFRVSKNPASNRSSRARPCSGTTEKPDDTDWIGLDTNQSTSFQMIATIFPQT